MQSHCFRKVIFIKMATNSAFYRLLYFIEGFTFGEDGVPKRPGLITAIHRFLDKKNDFLFQPYYLPEAAIKPPLDSNTR